MDSRGEWGGDLNDEPENRTMGFFKNNDKFELLYRSSLNEPHFTEETEKAKTKQFKTQNELG